MSNVERTQKITDVVVRTGVCQPVKSRGSRVPFHTFTACELAARHSPTHRDVALHVAAAAAAAADMLLTFISHLHPRPPWNEGRGNHLRDVTLSWLSAKLGEQFL